jgi:NADPH:quinone reductase-like Zn-dependent oxidoreductase
MDFLYELGADEVIDYHDEKFEDKIKDVDLVFDLVGGNTQQRSIQVIKKGGKLVTTVKPENLESASEKNIKIVGYLTQSRSTDLQQIADLIDSGKIKPVVTHVFQLKDAAEAQRQIESHHTRGKIVLKVR